MKSAAVLFYFMTLTMQNPDHVYFVVAQEEFASANGWRPLSPPASLATVFAQLAANDYSCREIASKKLKKVSRLDVRWLYWGTKHRDPEIRSRCLTIMRDLTICWWCDGTGLCAVYRAKPGEDWMCRACGESTWCHGERSYMCLICRNFGTHYKGVFE